MAHRVSTAAKPACDSLTQSHTISSATTKCPGETMTRERRENEELMDIVQFNGKKARDCTPRECELIGEFYYKLAELQTIAEKLRCPRPLDLRRLVTLAYRAAEETQRIGGKNPFLSEIIYH